MTNTKTMTMTIEAEIRQVYAALGHELASPGIFGSAKWQANSQYGYCLSEHDTREEAEQAALGYYSERMNLIRQ